MWHLNQTVTWFFVRFGPAGGGFKSQCVLVENMQTEKCWRQRISVNINVIKKSRASQSYRWANFRKIKHHLPFLIFGSRVFYLKTIINSVINFYFLHIFSSQIPQVKWVINLGWRGGQIEFLVFWSRNSNIWARFQCDSSELKWFRTVLITQLLFRGIILINIFEKGGVKNEVAKHQESVKMNKQRSK